MDDQVVKLVLFALIILGSVIKSATDKKRKDDLLKRRGADAPRPRAESPKGPQGKSLADWIEEIRRESDGKAAAPSRPAAAPKAEPQPEIESEEVVIRHERHEAPRPTGTTPRESIKAARESEHVFQKAARPSVDIDEEEAPEAPRQKAAFREAQVARVAPRYESGHAEQVVELDPRAGKAQRARRARRATREGGEPQQDVVARTGIGKLGLNPGDLRKAFIMKEILEPPLALRRKEDQR